MRLGLLSDVHANLFALRRAIERLSAEGVDRWVCAGDIVGYGPHPNECVETIAALDPLCVAGNHELLLLGAIPDRRAGRLARASIVWTREVLRPDLRAYLAGLPCTAAAPGLLLTHGSLDDPEEYVRTDERAAAQLRRLAAEHPDARVLVVGHTHRQRLFGESAGAVQVTPGVDVDVAGPERFLLNPGAVGQSRDWELLPRARFALLDLERGRARFFAELYDAGACRAALRERGLPPESIHVWPGRAAAAVQRTRWGLRSHTAQQR